MPFEKGHKPYKGGGRPKGSKNRGRNVQSQKNSSLDVYRSCLRKDWEKQALKRTLDPAEVDYYLYNDLDVTELYDNITYYDKHERDFDRNEREKRRRNNRS